MVAGKRPCGNGQASARPVSRLTSPPVPLSTLDEVPGRRATTRAAVPASGRSLPGTPKGKGWPLTRVRPRQPG